MSHIQFTDELVREYLLFRGFSGALKALDSDLKLDKDKGFRVDKIVDQLFQHICNYDLTGLRDTWGHLDSRLFVRLEHNFAPSIRKLENAVLKFYLVNAYENNKQEKITEFFNKLTNELVGQSEWKDWFVFPFLKNADEHAVFGVYFTRQWQDTLLVSLYNFLAAVYQCMPQPTLSSFEENASKMVALQKENDIIRKGLINLMNDQEKVIGSEQTPVRGFEAIMDDFFNISQEIKENENQAKILKTIMKNIGSVPTSPKLESKEQSVRISHRKHSGKKAPETKRSLSIDARPSHLKPRERDSSLDLTTARTSREVPQKKDEGGDKVQAGNLLFLSREEYKGHQCHITGIKINMRGNYVASADIAGNLKLWSMSPSCKTLASFSTHQTISCLEWVKRHDRYVACGNEDGQVTFFDKTNIVKFSINVEGEGGKRIDDLASSLYYAIVFAVTGGKIFVMDLRKRKVQECLDTTGEATCVRVHEDSEKEIFVLVGTQEGCVLMVDYMENEVMEKWALHQSPIYELELTGFGYLYSLGRDKINCKWIKDPTKNEQTINIPEEMKIHPEPHGRLFCLNRLGDLMLTVGINSGVIFNVEESGLEKSLELGGHSKMLTCVDWHFANECATCVTASQDGKIKISTLLRKLF